MQELKEIDERKNFKIIHGSRAVAEAVKLAKAQVVAAYPITPQTHIVEDLAGMIANGELKAEYVKVESEHSAISVCIAASAAGARVFTATASQGLALMHEVLFVASGMRLPVVMVNANRALSAPLSIWNDYQDSIAQRDSGWIQIYVESNQEALDSVIQAYKIAEKVYLPAMVCMDGFVLTHTVEPVEIPEQSKVDEFLPSYEPEFKLDPNSPVAFGAFAPPSSYMEFRYEQEKAMREAEKEIKKAGKEFGEYFGRSYELIEKYNEPENKSIVLLTLGSLSGTIKDTIDEFEQDVGFVRVRAFRPFPEKEIKEAIKNAGIVGVIEKDVSIGLGKGALASELRDALYSLKQRPKVLSFVAGLGGRDIPMRSIRKVIKLCREAERKDIEEKHWLDLNRDILP